MQFHYFFCSPGTSRSVRLMTMAKVKQKKTQTESECLIAKINHHVHTLGTPRACFFHSRMQFIFVLPFSVNNDVKWFNISPARPWERDAQFFSLSLCLHFLLWSWQFEFLTGSTRDGSVAIPHTLVTQAPFLDLKRGWTSVNKVLAWILKPACAFVSAYHLANYSKKNLTTNLPFVIVTVR